MMAWSRPNPDSTHTINRSRAFGSARVILFLRRLTSKPSTSFGTMNPSPADATIRNIRLSLLTPRRIDTSQTSSGSATVANALRP